MGSDRRAPFPLVGYLGQWGARTLCSAYMAGQCASGGEVGKGEGCCQYISGEEGNGCVVGRPRSRKDRSCAVWKDHEGIEEKAQTDSQGHREGIKAYTSITPPTPFTFSTSLSPQRTRARHPIAATIPMRQPTADTIARTPIRRQRQLGPIARPMPRSR